MTLKTRKSLALLVYLLRSPSHTVSREELTDVFWSEAPRERASQSLRQALRQVKTLEKHISKPFFEARNQFVSIDPDAFELDIDTIEALVLRGGRADFEDARRLWRGEFLGNFDSLDPNFGDWLRLDRERLCSWITANVMRRIDHPERRSDGLREAGAQFLLTIDPSSEVAHRVLIRHFLQTGQRELAVAQYKTCARELKMLLDAEPEPETRALLQDIPKNLPELNGSKTPVTDQAQFKTGAHVSETMVLPHVSIASLGLGNSRSRSATSLRDEVLAGLSALRMVDLFQADVELDTGSANLARVDDPGAGTYMLRVRYDDEQRRVYFQFEDRVSGRILFHDIFEDEMLAKPGEVRVSAAQAIRRIQAHLQDPARSLAKPSAFSTWCEVSRLMWDFTPESEERASRMLDDLETRFSSFSPIYAARASSHMKHRLHFPSKSGAEMVDVASVLALTEKAVGLDPWQSMNQRMMGWALLQSGHYPEARRAFEEAGRLSSLEPENLMSVAEGLSIAGDVEGGRYYADKAQTIKSSLPRVFYEYLANIYFANGEYETALYYIERAPNSTLIGVVIRVACLFALDRGDQIGSVLDLYRKRNKDLFKKKEFFLQPHHPWDERICFFQDPLVRERFKQGALCVREAVVRGG
ncbi:BTAD domain-containing putative transcriptional regulator [Roseibium aquae]|uniref:BTAD domain-containing putative transcriptional regulator n=1 Tax=Roseibium aquae TaxID=1323746 RepID=UPI0015627188|nr:BTAD domain-containing putative transcriptional regulator [Roseibium aquae]